MNSMFNTSPLEILIRDFFDKDDNFLPATQFGRNSNPVDMYEDTDGLHIEVACTGIPKEEVKVTIEGNVIRIKYDKPKNINRDDSRAYFLNRISRSSFNLGYKLSSKFNLKEANAKYENGLLSIHIPFAQEGQPQTLTIN